MVFFVHVVMGHASPDLSAERILRAAGHTLIAGIDEAGRGAWAGPVYAAAVILPLDRRDLLTVLSAVRDSKQLSPAQRERLFPIIREIAVEVGIGHATAAEVDDLGIVPATRLAMTRAIVALPENVDALLIDHVQLPKVLLPQWAFPKADRRSLSVAAASIIAKVARDRLMVALDERYPGYDFAGNKGYGTRRHREALCRLGPTPIHRHSWRPIREIVRCG